MELIVSKEPEKYGAVPSVFKMNPLSYSGKVCFLFFFFEKEKLGEK